MYDVLAVLGFILGISAVSPWVYGLFQKPRIEYKFVSSIVAYGDMSGSQCLLHFLAINLLSLNKNFYIKDVKISTKYKDIEKPYPGTLFWPADYKLTKEVNGDKITTKLFIEPEDHMVFTSTLLKNEGKVIYFTFSDDKAKVGDIEYIKITFTGYKNIEQTITINNFPVDPKRTLWDDRIWKEIFPTTIIETKK